MAEESTPEPGCATWVLDITRSASDVRGIVQHIVRAGESGGETANLVVFAAMEGASSLPCFRPAPCPLRRVSFHLASCCCLTFGEFSSEE